MPTRPKYLRSRSFRPQHSESRGGPLLPGGGGERYQRPRRRLSSLLKCLHEKVSPGIFHRRFVACLIVLVFSITGAVATGLALKCSTPVSKPTVDGNFWSMLSQALVGQAGLCCIIIPILRHAKIKARGPRLFKATLILSFTSGIASVIVYPYYVRTNLVLAFVSALAQLLATLQLIEDSDNMIQEASEEIDSLENQLEFERLRSV